VTLGRVDEARAELLTAAAQCATTAQQRVLREKAAVAAVAGSGSLLTHVGAGPPAFVS
jgi:hypothetical protein